LDLDEEGWIGIDNLLDSMGKYCNIIEVKKENLYELIANQQKNRFEIKMIESGHYAAIQYH
jgi:RNA:NAD 2'-phosphotransferase (TPT1/KptA family)